MSSSMDAEHLALATDVLNHEEDVTRIFLLQYIPLIGKIARKRWSPIDDTNIQYDPKDTDTKHEEPLHNLQELVLDTIEYIIYGLRPAGTIVKSPLQKWLDNSDKRVPLDHFVGKIAKEFISRDMRRKTRVIKNTTYVEDYDVELPLKNVMCTIEDNFIAQMLFDGWWKTLTEDERQVIHLVSPAFEGLTQSEAAGRLGVSGATMSRTVKKLKLSLITYMQAD